MEIKSCITTTNIIKIIDNKTRQWLLNRIQSFSSECYSTG